MIEQHNESDNKELRDIKYALDQSAIVAITDKRGTITHVNDLFVEISKYSKEELIGSNHRIINSGVHPREFFQDMWRTIATGSKWRGEICNKTKHGEYYWVDTTIIPLLNDDGRVEQYVSIRSDITKQKNMEKEIEKSNELYKLIANNSSDLIAVVSKEGEFQYVSPSFKSVLGYNAEQLKFSDIYQLILREDVAEVKRRVRYAYLMMNSITSMEIRIQDSKNSIACLETSINPVQDDGEYEGHLLFVMRDISERKKADQRIEDLSSYDQLTNMPNRMTFRRKVNFEVTQAVRTDAVLALFMLNIDRMRYVNDSFGHESGDYVLSVVAQRLKRILPDTEMVGRLSGDEFAFMLQELPGTSSVEKIAEEVLSYLEEPIDINGQPYILSVSMGVAICPEHTINPTELIMMAEKALHNQKASGGSGYELYRSGTVQKTLERILLERELRKSIQQEHFNLEYQPKFNLETAQLIGVEALVRWDHPELGRITPDRFIPIAEETKMILELGDWILRTACLQIKEWESKGFEPIRVSVNMSLVQLEDPNIVQSIETIIQETNISSEHLEIEITESAFSEQNNIKEKIQAIRKLGVLVSIDDFGTGYSTFSYIKELPADILKIDMAFIRDIHINDKSRAIVQAIISLAKTVNLRVIAEGIEYIEQAEILLEDGCYEGQGYYLSRPVAPEECVQYMEKR